VMCTAVRLRSCDAQVPQATVAVLARDRADLEMTNSVTVPTPLLVPSPPLTVINAEPVEVPIAARLPLNFTIQGPFAPNAMLSFTFSNEFAREVRDYGECTTTAHGAILRMVESVLVLALPGDYTPTPSLNPDANAGVITEKLDCLMNSGKSVYDPTLQPVEVVLSDLVNGQYSLTAVSTVQDMPTVRGLRFPVVTLAVTASERSDFMTSAHLNAAMKVLNNEVMRRCNPQARNKLFVHQHTFENKVATVVFAMYCSQEANLLDLVTSRLEAIIHGMKNALPHEILACYDPAYMPADTVTSNVLNNLHDVVDETDTDCGAATIRKCSSSDHARCTKNEDCDNNLCDVYAELKTHHSVEEGDLPLYQFGTCVPNSASKIATAVVFTLIAVCVGLLG